MSDSEGARDDARLVTELRILQNEWRVTDEEFSSMIGVSGDEWRMLKQRPTARLEGQVLHRAQALVEIGERLKTVFAPGIAADWMTIETGRWGAPRPVDVCRDPAGLAVVLAHVRALCEGY